MNSTKCIINVKNGSMSPWEMVKELGIYTEEQIEEMTWAECVEILNQEE